MQTIKNSPLKSFFVKSKFGAQVAGTKTANPLDVEDYLDFFESYSPQLLRYIVNMPDGNVS